MKKILLIFLVSIFFLSFYALTVNAQQCDESAGGNGLVPCGREVVNGIVICPCQLYHVGILFLNIFNFIVLQISVPLAGLLIVIGGVVLVFSGGNPGLASLAKRILWGAIIGILLIWGSYLIIKTVLSVIGYIGPF